MDIKDLTAAGWLLIVITIVGALGLGIPILIILDEATGDARIKKPLLLTPTFLIGLAIFLGGAWLLKRMGKPIRRQ